MIVTPIATRRHTVILILILAAIALAGFAANRKPATRAASSPAPVYVSVLVGQLALVWYVRSGLRGITLLELAGGRPRIVDLLIGPVLWIVARLLLDALRHALGGSNSRVSGLMPRTVPEQALWIALSIAAGVCEELVYRGYLQRQFTALTSSAPAAIVIQAVLFGVSHAYQDLRSVALITVFAVLFGLVALMTRRLYAGMLAHAITDIVAGLRVF